VTVTHQKDDFERLLTTS